MADEELLELLDRVLALAEVLGDGTRFEAKRHDLEALALFNRCDGLARAARLLVTNGFSQEAMILTRPLLTESLVLGEYAASDEKRRVEIAVGWELANVADLEGIIEEAARRGDDQVDAAREVLSKRKNQLEAYARKHDARTRHWSPEEKSLADSQGRGDEYLDLRMSHHFVHGSTFATRQRYAPDDEGSIMIGGSAAEAASWSGGVAGSASQSMLYAVRAYCRIIEREEPPEVEQLLERVEELADERQAESGSG